MGPHLINREVLTSESDWRRLIVTIHADPAEAVAYAMVAGLPPVVGLYRFDLPLVAYALFGTSRTLAVWAGGVWISLMTASAAASCRGAGHRVISGCRPLPLRHLFWVIGFGGAWGCAAGDFLANLLSHRLFQLVSFRQAAFLDSRQASSST